MELRTLNVDKMIWKYNMGEVTSHFISGPGSLFDPDIFGSRIDNDVKFGYINLRGNFIDPSLYAVSSRVFRELQYIVDGTKKYKIVNGDLIQDPDGDTGLDWFYDNFEDIQFNKVRKVLESGTNRMQSNLMKQAFLKLKKKDFFINKLIVLPIRYRDLNTDSDSMVQIDELNQYYMELIKAVANKDRFKSSGLNNVRSLDIKIQGLIQKIYEYMSDRLFHKNGAQRKLALSRSVDNSARTVIISPEVKMNDVIGKNSHSLNNASVPLHHIMNLHPVHAVSATRSILNQLFNENIIKGDRDEFEYHFNDEHIKEQMENYYSAPALRLEPLYDHNNNLVKIWFKYSEDGKPDEIIERPITWLEIFYMAVQMFLHKTRGLITRYPVTGKDSVVLVKLHPSTINGEKGTLSLYKSKEDLEYGVTFDILDNFPNISEITKNYTHKDRPSLFEEATRFSNMYLDGLGGDYKYHCSL